MKKLLVEQLLSLLEGVIISIKFPGANKSLNIRLVSTANNNEISHKAALNRNKNFKRTIQQDKPSDAFKISAGRGRGRPALLNDDNIAELENFIKNNSELMTYKELAEKRGIATSTLFKAVKKYNLSYQIKKHGKRRGKLAALDPSLTIIANTDLKKEVEDVEKKEEVKQSVKDDANKLIDEKTEQELAAFIKRAVEMDNNFSMSYDDVMKFDNEFSKFRDKKIIIQSSSLGSWTLRTFDGRAIEFNKLAVFNSYHVFPFKEIGRTIMIFEDRYNGNAVRFSVWWKANREIVANWELRTNNLAAALAYDRTRKKRE